MKVLFPLALAGVIAGTTALANPPLKDVEAVREGLITAGMALELDDKCGDVSVRMIRGLNFLRGLENHARDLGYSEAEIDAYTSDSVEEERLKGIARARLSDLGVVPGDEATYCTVARAQIQQGTQLGRLLR